MLTLTGLGRSPWHEMTAGELLAIVQALESAGISAWLDGGWAVDAALGEQRRRHDDLDLIVELRDAERLQSIVGERGYAVGSGGLPESFELVDADGRQIDVHPVRMTANGDGLYRMASGADWTYPARGFAGHGSVSGRRVRCLTSEVQILCHTGYEPHRASYDDVWALSRRFGVSVPDEYRQPRATYPERRPTS